MPFARALLARNPGFGVIGLVPCAYGGSKIAEWQPGKYLYEELIKRAKAAMKSGGELKGLLWLQGGADSTKKEGAESYKANLVNFFSRVRFDLNSPDLLIIQVLTITDLHFHDSNFSLLIWFFPPYQFTFCYVESQARI